MNPARQPLTVQAWIKADKPYGVIVAHGGSSAGYALYLDQGRPTFAVRAGGELAFAQSTAKAVGRWVQLTGVLELDGTLRIFVDGTSVGEKRGAALIPGNPQEGLEIGADEGSNVGDYVQRRGFNGWIDDVRIYHHALSADEIRGQHSGDTERRENAEGLVLAYSFDEGKASDLSGNENHGVVEDAAAETGRAGIALRFDGAGTRVAGYEVVHHWTEDLPLFARVPWCCPKIRYSWRARLI